MLKNTARLCYWFNNESKWRAHNRNHESWKDTALASIIKVVEEAQVLKHLFRDLLILYLAILCLLVCIAILTFTIWITLLPRPI